MAQFNGKWLPVESENAEALLKAVKAPEEFKTLLQKIWHDAKTNPSAYFEELKVDTAANTVQRIVHIKGEQNRDSGAQPIGVEYDGRCYGKPAKVKLTLQSPTKITRTEKGDDFTSQSTFEVKGDELKITITSGSVTGVEKFKRST